jgi:hypothetical protein
MVFHALCVDFEASDHHGMMVMAFAGAVFEFPTGRLLASIERRNICTTYHYDRPTREFWDRHIDAHNYIFAPGKGSTMQEAYAALSAWIEQAMAAYPRAQVVSDNPAFDIAAVNRVMMMHDRPKVQIHPVTPGVDRAVEGRYTPVICATTFERTVRAAVGEEQLAKAADRFRCEPPAALMQDGACRHTPLFDCHQIMQRYGRAIVALRSLGKVSF